MADLTLRLEVDGGTTLLTVEGPVAAHQCRMLRDGLETARILRPTGPIVVDLGRARRIPVAALLMLHRAADDARRAGRAMTLRNLHSEAVDDLRGARLLQDLWAKPPAEPIRSGPTSRPRKARRRLGLA